VQGPVLQSFDYDEAHPYAPGQHRGIDIGAAAEGQTVVAPAAGAVTFAGTVPTNGKTVTIDTADGYSVTLTHLGSIGVARGAQVDEQDEIGTVGPSGTPAEDGPYVHLGIRVTADQNGYVDPLGLLPPIAADGATDNGSSAPQPIPSATPAGKPASSPPTSKAAKTQGSAAAADGHVVAHEHRRAQEPRAEGRPNRSQHRSAVRDGERPLQRTAARSTSSRRPVVETAAPLREPARLGAGHEVRSSAPAVQSRHARLSPLLELACNWAAALFALGAALLAHRRRRPSSAQVLHLPQRAFDPQRVSRAA
ncbi:MAG: peptidoglycan DD-metalloendopeptidase family protein, partial [Gaiellaceae bacterium]